MKKFAKTQKGFTLIEVLVALSIFVIFVTSMSTTYLHIARSQREANSIRAMYSDLRYVMTILSDEARAKTVDYACYSSNALAGSFSTKCNDVRASAGSVDYLALIDRASSNRTIFIVEENNEDVKDLKVFKEHKTFDNNGLETWVANEGYTAGYQPIALDTVKLEGLEFEIAPLADPFDPDNVACGPVQFQPSVTVNAAISGVTPDTDDFRLDIQTSLSSRVYNLKTNT
ncbi:PilW family protein [Patescibacteria group bacterium]